MKICSGVVLSMLSAFAAVTSFGDAADVRGESAAILLMSSMSETFTAQNA